MNNLSWGAARSYCSRRGMRMVSLDDAAKRDHFMQQVAADGAPYFWAGGRISGDKRNLSWENGRSQGISKGRHPWSFTGSRGAQPDGRGSEDCLAILNNFYNVSLIKNLVHSIPLVSSPPATPSLLSYKGLKMNQNIIFFVPITVLVHCQLS